MSFRTNFGGRNTCSAANPGPTIYLFWCQMSTWSRIRRRCVDSRPLFWPVPSPRGCFWGLSSPNKSPRPPNWIMKHYKSVEFFSNFRKVKPSWTKENPLLKIFWRRFWFWPFSNNIIGGKQTHRRFAKTQNLCGRACWLNKSKKTPKVFKNTRKPNTALKCFEERVTMKGWTFVDECFKPITKFEVTNLSGRLRQGHKDLRCTPDLTYNPMFLSFDAAGSAAKVMTFDDPATTTQSKACVKMEQTKFHWRRKTKSEIEKEPHKRSLKCVLVSTTWLVVYFVRATHEISTLSLGSGRLYVYYGMNGALHHKQAIKGDCQLLGYDHGRRKGGRGALAPWIVKFDISYYMFSKKSFLC